MNPKNIRIYGGNAEYFIQDQYQKDNNFDYEDSIFDCSNAIFDCKDTNLDSKYTIFYDQDVSYYYYIDVDRILLFKSGNKYFIRYKHSNKMVPIKYCTITIKIKKILL